MLLGLGGSLMCQADVCCSDPLPGLKMFKKHCFFLHVRSSEAIFFGG
jgi:hypothetical protein